MDSVIGRSRPLVSRGQRLSPSLCFTCPCRVAFESPFFYENKLPVLKTK